MIENKKVLAITLARGGSKRVPKKNISVIEGKPLIQYTIDEVKKSNLIDRYIISSDDDDVIHLATDLNCEIHKRSQKNSSDVATSASAIQEVLNDIRSDYDYVVEIMCTNPLKTIEDIDGVIKKLHETGSDSVVSVVRVWDHHPSRIKFIKDDKLIDVYPEIPESRRQDLDPPAFIRNGSVYAFTLDSFKKCKNRLGPDTKPYIMPEERSINIDEKYDLELAKIIIRDLKKKL